MTSPSKLYPHLPAGLALRMAAYLAAFEEWQRADEQINAAERALLDVDAATDQNESSVDRKRREAEQALREWRPKLPGLAHSVFVTSRELYSQVMSSDAEENPWVNTAQLLQRVKDANDKERASSREYEVKLAQLVRELRDANTRLDKVEGALVDHVIERRDIIADRDTYQQRLEMHEAMS